MAKYTNMTTIFEKVRRGDIDVENTRTFNTISYYKRPELIKPYLHYMDKNRLIDSVDGFMNQTNINEAVLRYFGRDKKIDPEQMRNDVDDIYKQYFPDSVISDIFNMYLHEPSSLDYEERTDANKFRYKILDKTVDSVTRVASQDSRLKSLMLSRNMVQYMTLAMAYAKQVAPEDFEQMKNELNPNGDGDQDGDQDSQDNATSGSGSGSGESQENPQGNASDILDKLLNNKAMERMKEDLIDQAKSQISTMDEMLSEEDMESAWNKGDGEKDDMFDKNAITRIQKEIRKFKLNMDGVKKFIAKLLDKSQNYFSSKEIVQFDSIWDADSLDGLQDYELLHPKLRKLFIDDIMIKSVKKEGKIDLYIDISGSMSESYSYGDTYMTSLDFAKAFAMAMMDAKLINKIYAFDTSVHKMRTNVYSLMLLDDGGGTNITRVVEHIDKIGNNAIVITDAEDHCHKYSPLAYMIGVEGCMFRYFDNEVIEKYSKARQVVKFNGKKIYDIDTKGDVIQK